MNRFSRASISKLHKNIIDAAAGSGDAWRLPTELVGAGILCCGVWKRGQDSHVAVLSLCDGITFSFSNFIISSNAWWRHKTETFSALLAICAGNSPVTGEFPTQRPVTRSFDVFFDLHLNERLSKQSWNWWFETPSSPLWRHCNGMSVSLTEVWKAIDHWILQLGVVRESLWVCYEAFLSSSLLLTAQWILIGPASSQRCIHFKWRWHDMDTVSTLLVALCVVSPWGFPAQRVSNGKLWLFLCCQAG